MEKKITKAEMLWTRTCPLNCSYCNMVTGETNSKPLQYWKNTAEQLKKLNCRFAAFYGAEPLSDKEDLEKLAYTIEYFQQCGIDTTVITSGVVSSFRDKLKFLHEHGLRSLTMSYDILPLDRSSERKSAQAIADLLWFRSLGVRDVAAVTTLTKWNYHLLPESIATLSHLGIWTFFDLIHDDRGQEGSKCRHTDITEKLLFNDYHYKALGDVLKKVAQMKKAGFLCNTSLPFIDLLEENDFQHIKRYDWNCARCAEFPGWVSIDCDGNVYPCDDFHCKDVYFMSDRIYDEFDVFADTYKSLVIEKCPGCLWNTHIDANAIKGGILSGYGIEDAKKD